MSAPILEARGLEAWYGPARALHGVDFAVEEGGVTAVLGANGAGKTTILRALSGLIRRAGDIRFRGKPIGALATEDIARLGVAHVPDGRGTFIDLTVEENLRLGAYVRADRQGVRSDFDRMFGLFPRLGERRRQQAGTLSGGEQQMLAIARALLMRPRLLMLDEPSFGLAPLVVAEIFRILGAINRDEGVSLLIVEQNASLALDLADRAVLIETGSVALERPLAGDARRRCSAPRLSRLLTAGRALSLVEFLHQLASGLALGGVYAIMALALVMIYQATHLINFAQGEMAMFSTYFAWKLMDLGEPYWFAFFAAVIVSFIGGIAIERLVVRPFANAPVLASIIVFIGLALIFNALAGWLYGYTVTSFDSPFSGRPWFGAGYMSAHESGAVIVTFCVLALVYAFFRFTPLGLAMRAAAQNPVSSRLVGIRVGWMLAIGWGLAAAIGSIAGMMAAPIVYLDPNMMGGVLLYAFAGAVLGGIDNPFGAVFGGFAVGVLGNLVGAYVVGEEVKLSVALAIIIAVLVWRPSGLFGRRLVARV